MVGNGPEQHLTASLGAGFGVSLTHVVDHLDRAAMLACDLLQRSEDLGGHFLGPVLFDITRHHHQWIHNQQFVAPRVTSSFVLEGLIQPCLPGFIGDGERLSDVGIDVREALELGAGQPFDEASLHRDLVTHLIGPHLAESRLDQRGGILFLDVENRTRFFHSEVAEEWLTRSNGQCHIQGSPGLKALRLSGDESHSTLREDISDQPGRGFEVLE